MAQARRRKVDELRTEYDFSRAERGKRHASYKAGTNVVLLEDDVARAFPDSSSVNRVLPAILEVARTQLSSKRTA